MNGSVTRVGYSLKYSLSVCVCYAIQEHEKKEKNRFLSGICMFCWCIRQFCQREREGFTLLARHSVSDTSWWLFTGLRTMVL